jgi:hypothetical protein
MSEDNRDRTDQTGAANQGQGAQAPYTHSDSGNSGGSKTTGPAARARRPAWNRRLLERRNPRAESRVSFGRAGLRSPPRGRRACRRWP